MFAQSTEVMLYSATIHARDGVLFEAEAGSAHELVSRVAEFVGARCAHVLWPADASRTQDLLEQGNPYAAIALYFARVGDRWDEEWLELALPTEDEAEPWSDASGELAVPGISARSTAVAAPDGCPVYAMFSRVLTAIR